MSPRSLQPKLIQPTFGQHWDLLDGLRGLAILLVVCSHGFYANPQGPKWLLWAGNFIGAGAIGVQMFFVLSGFLIAYPFLKAKQNRPDAWYPSGYITRRWLKIIPPFWLCIGALAVYYSWRYQGVWPFAVGLEWIVGLPHFFFLPEALQFNGSFWSLWVEIGFYALLPVGFWFLRGRNVQTTAGILAAVFFSVSMIASLLSWPGATVEPGYFVYINGRFPNSLGNFGWGILFAGFFVARRSTDTPSRSWARAGYAGIATLLLALLIQGAVVQLGWERHWSAHALKILLSGSATFLLLYFLFDTNAAGSRLLSLPWLKYLGVVSYEWFLLHQPIILEFRRYCGSAEGNLLKYLFIVVTPMVATLFAAILIYHFFSAPIIERGRDWLARRKSAAPKA